MKIPGIPACALVLFCASVIACSDGFPPEFPAADFTLKSPLTDKQVSFADVRGKPVVIYWFASW